MLSRKGFLLRGGGSVARDSVLEMVTPMLSIIQQSCLTSQIVLDNRWKGDD